MKPLDLAGINPLSPYTIWQKGSRYYFKTDYDILYAISFDKEDLWVDEDAYWFNLSNMSNKKSPGDRKIAPTIARIITSFFDANPDILLYMCDTADGQQAERNRLFLRWFKSYNKEDLFTIKWETVEDEGTNNYISIIVQNSNPNLDAIIETFKEQIRLFKDNK